jgi:hypothetical protein
VVAGEVKALAEQTSIALDDLGTRVAAIQRGRRRAGPYRRAVARREYGSISTYTDEFGALVVQDVDGTFRDRPTDVTGELARLRADGWELVEIETAETPVAVGGTQRQVLVTTYLLSRS